MDDFINISKESYGEDYQEHVLDLYKVYLNTAEKISDRRLSTNQFFLTLNTALISGFSLAEVVLNNSSNVYFILFLASGILFSFIWLTLINSYKNLNTAKFSVIHELEKLLPVSLFKSEWVFVEEGKNKQKYFPFSHVEQFIPWLFIIVYAFMIFYNVYQVCLCQCCK